MNIEEPNLVQEDASLKNQDTKDMHEQKLQEIYKQATEVSLSSTLFLVSWSSMYRVQKYFSSVLTWKCWVSIIWTDLSPF